MKQPKELNSNDPTSLITAALKKRFAIMHSPASSHGTANNSYSEDDECNKENDNKSQSLSDDDDDLFEEHSPRKFRPSRLFKTTGNEDNNGSTFPVLRKSSRLSFEKNSSTKAISPSPLGRQSSKAGFGVSHRRSINDSNK